MFAWPWGLPRRGVLGINRRNLDYILRNNPRGNYPLVDDKLATKQLAEKAGIAVPPLYGVFTIQREVRGLAALVRERHDFVIKPNRGSGGNGIIVITEHHGDHFRKANGDLVDEHALRHHLSNILNGLYSLGGQADSAFVEYRVESDPIFDSVSYRGVPDIRIVVFRGVPVMAMVRLPTRQSDGKANLHQGAVGAGIDLASGQTLDGVLGTRSIALHPDTDMPLAGLQIPGWEHLLTTAARCFELTGLGYLGADFVLDRERGPLLLELNARPGLNIQIANHAGLEGRLAAIEREQAERLRIDLRVAFARERFISERL